MSQYNRLLEKVRNELYQEGLDPSNEDCDYTIRRTIQIILKDKKFNI